MTDDVTVVSKTRETVGLEGNCSKPVVLFIWISLDLGMKAT